MYRTVVLNVVGLTPRLLGDGTPNLAAFGRTGGMRPLETILPAVTCAVQSTFTTGALPRDHGCVANGWYFRDLSEVWLWRQSNRLVAGEKTWEAAARRDPAFTCATLFWWYNMYSSATYAVTPRRRISGRNSPRGSGRSRSSTSGDRGRESGRAAGSPSARGTCTTRDGRP